MREATTRSRDWREMRQDREDFGKAKTFFQDLYVGFLVAVSVADCVHNRRMLLLQTGLCGYTLDCAREGKAALSPPSL